MNDDKKFAQKVSDLLEYFERYQDENWTVHEADKRMSVRPKELRLVLRWKK